MKSSLKLVVIFELFEGMVLFELVVIFEIIFVSKLFESVVVIELVFIFEGVVIYELVFNFEPMLQTPWRRGRLRTVWRIFHFPDRLEFFSSSNLDSAPSRPPYEAQVYMSLFVK